MGRSTVFVVLGALAYLGFVSACLSDLDPRKAVDGGRAEEPEAAARTTCGDGIIATLDDGGDAGERCDPGPGGSAAGCTPQCTIACSGIVSPAGHCYFLADPSTHVEAAENCDRARGHLVTIGSREELAIVRTLVGDAGYRILLEEDRARGGYVTRLDEPGWPIGSRCDGCFASGADADGGFRVRPDAGADHGCIASTANDEWVQVPCIEPAGDPDVVYATVCEREPPGQRAQYCGGPYCTTVPATAGRKRYVISLDLANAEAAAEACRGYEGGRLVILDSPMEREQLAREVRRLLDEARPPEDNPRPGATEVWLGLSASDAGWRWDDGTSADDAGRPAPWGSDEPKPTATGRAFLRLRTGRFDVQLAATTNDPDAPKVFVCERR